MNLNKLKQNLILSIDTSCDDTSVAITKGNKVISNLLPSQTDLHKQYGGVVPSIAKLAHAERIDSVINEALKRAKVSVDQVDAIAVTKGPGLSIALEIGIKKAKELAEKFNKPLIAANHMEGHLLSGLALRNSNFKADNLQFPSLGVLISGGHTELILVEQVGKYKKIGETLDDACGECFDKCGRMLGLGYPAGPVISKLAKENRKNLTLEIVNKNSSVLVRGTNKKTNQEYLLPIAMANSNDLNFSYSGLKTAFRDFLGRLGQENLNEQTLKDLCVVFEHAALMQVVYKVKKAIKIHSPKEVWLGGGVVASARLRSLIRKELTSETLRFPFSKTLTGDNAAMIGVTANYQLNENREVYTSNFEKIDREPNLTF